MAEYISPGIYVEEFDSDIMPIVGVSTSITGFIGLTERGPIGGLPVLVTAWSDFTRIFGGLIDENRFGDYRFLPHCVRSYFANGGNCCYIARVVPKNAQAAFGLVQKGEALFKLTASNAGAWGNEVIVSFIPSTQGKFNVRIICPGMTETYTGVLFQPDHDDYIVNQLAKSALINIDVQADDANEASPRVLIGENEDDTCELALRGGSDGLDDPIDGSIFIGDDGGAGNPTGLQAFLDNEEVSIMVIPGITDEKVQLSLIAHCENLGNRFAVLDLPQKKNGVADIMPHRGVIDSSYAAFYHPWLEVFDPGTKRNTFIPPSGAVAGIYARVDQIQGVHKAPSNVEVLDSLDLQYKFGVGEQDILNSKGINVIRWFPGRGILVWGGRTCAAERQWRYVNERRLFIFLEESIKRSTNWVIFEVNDQKLWTRIKQSVENFLRQMWKVGALMGASPEEAFFVRVDESTMNPNDMADGRLICVIGVAISQPCEFVILKITQKTGK